MLLELHIKDYILIENASLPFGRGLNVITGETGAGKSMVVGALELLLGKKASSSTIRSGAEKAIITAVFDLGGNLAGEIVRMSGTAIDDDTLILVREIRTDGRTIARVNGQPVPIQTLRLISSLLFRIHGQNEQLELFHREYQLDLLDEFAGHDLRRPVRDLYVKMSGALEHRNALQEKFGDRATKLDFLTFQRDEIADAQLKAGEDEALEREYDYLTSLERIAETVSHVGAWLSDSSVQDISEITRSFRKISDLSEGLKSLYTQLSELESLLGDFSGNLQRYAEHMESDRGRLSETERRLDHINTLKRKYGGSLDEIAEHLRRTEQEILTYERLEQEAEAAERAYDRARREYGEVAERLGKNRKEAADRLAKEIVAELREFQMPEAKLEIAVEKGTPTERGADEVDIRIATAVGHPLQSIKKVVSGGELSRIMLAVQLIVGEVNTMLFDEIDAGISGRTAGVVGEKLARLGRRGQLICITHLPQIAVFADRHILIEKSSDETATTTRIREISEGERIAEISRLIGGGLTGELTVAHAAEMIAAADRKKRDSTSGDRMKGGSGNRRSD